MGESIILGLSGLVPRVRVWGVTLALEFNVCKDDIQGIKAISKCRVILS